MKILVVIDIGKVCEYVGYALFECVISLNKQFSMIRVVCIVVWQLFGYELFEEMIVISISCFIYSFMRE